MGVDSAGNDQSVVDIGNYKGVELRLLVAAALRVTGWPAARARARALPGGAGPTVLLPVPVCLRRTTKELAAPGSGPHSDPASNGHLRLALHDNLHPSSRLPLGV